MFRVRKRGVRVVKAFSSPLRLRVLNLLSVRNQLSYTEIMGELKLNPSRDAGRFAYHLKLLLESDLIELDSTTKKYRLTDLGRMVVSMTEEIESRVSSRRKMLVRTSKASLEEFDRGKIVSSLATEAGVPLGQAQRIARETERRLQKFKTKYLTAPLIREIVNSVLIEKGLEEYRHKLTRLGLPVYDVTKLIRSASDRKSGINRMILSAGEKVFAEYTLLNVFPRDVADAHLSGVLHIEDLGNWILKPLELIHDLRFFFRHGTKSTQPYTSCFTSPPPKGFKAALETLVNVLEFGADEVSSGQTFQHFNVFLAPFAVGLKEEEVEGELRNFLNYANGLSKCREIALGIELSTPSFLERKKAYGPHGKKVGIYSDYHEESALIASKLIEIFLNGEKGLPALNPTPIFNIRDENLGKTGSSEDLLYKAHRLAAEIGLPLFANHCWRIWERSTCSSSGSRLNCGWTGDWELDNLRTGVLGRVVLNLPRVFYDSRTSKRRFDDLLDERVEMAVRALEIKYRAVARRGEEGLLPFLHQNRPRDGYFRLENSERLIGIVGLNEALTALQGREPRYEGRDRDFVEGLLKRILESVRNYANRYNARIDLSSVSQPVAAERLAMLDVEIYGWSRVSVNGDREHPIYTDTGVMPLSLDAPIESRLKVEGILHRETAGGHLALIQLGDLEGDADALLSMTRKAVKEFGVGLFAYCADFSYCSVCGSRSQGTPPKCPSCGSVDAYKNFGHVTNRCIPLDNASPTRLFLKSIRKKYVLASK